MSREAVASFISRVMEDEGFRKQLEANPDATLAKFDLTPEEITAIKSADPAKLEDLGVDARVTKTTLLPQAESTVMGSASFYQLLANLWSKKS